MPLAHPLRHWRICPNLSRATYVFIKKPNPGSESVQGTWILNPTLIIPAALLSRMLSFESKETEETLRNFHVQLDDGAIDVHIHIAPLYHHINQTSRRRMTIRLKSFNGAIKAAVVRVYLIRCLLLILIALVSIPQTVKDYLAILTLSL